ncbi:MAG TPA: sigma-54 dependent transcriptional regulator [Verrucomicrobiae bacterium]|nr:sigma-54 dependent transcriptional regulator [Verrucomicrobiae bacterium]
MSINRTHAGSTILIGEDELEVRDYLQTVAKCLGFSVETAADGDEVLSAVQELDGNLSAVLLDLLMPNRDGLETLLEIRRTRPDLPVIMLSGEASTLNIVRAMKMGATDFLCKPVSHEDLARALNRALEKNGALDAPAPPRKTSVLNKTFLGSNQRMAEIYALVAQVGWSEAPVLIQGETGTGKEVIARELHAQSPRATKPFLKLNCAALPSELVESELFGYERGSFTGAFQKKAGMFEMADGGTILLDEIGDMDVRLQAKLLQVLQDHEFHRIGGRETIKVDVRVMAATHRDLEAAIAARSFREDLYYRLNVINLVLPPLRERQEDIVPMAGFLMRKHAPVNVPMPEITPGLAQALMEHRWPGNVRELENVVRKFLILRDPVMLAQDLRPRAFPKPEAPPLRLPAAAGDARSVPGDGVFEQVSKAQQQVESDAILAALQSTRWNRKRAAALLKIDYKALLYKMKKLGLENRLSEDAGTGKTKANSASGIGD